MMCPVIGSKGRFKMVSKDQGLLEAIEVEALATTSMHTMTMTAAVLTEQGKPLSIIDNVLIPKPKYGQVLVKILFAGLCHSQLMEIDGKRGEDKYIPHMLGHEGIADVIEVGEGVTKVKPGDHVVLGWIKGSGLENSGTQYQTTDQSIVINAGHVTTFSEYAIVSENRLTQKPLHTPDDLSVLYGCAIPTGLGMVLNAIPENESCTVAFIGLGGIGLSALLSAKIRDFKQIIAIDTNPEKLALALDLGATHVINPLVGNVLRSIKMITNDSGVDYCFESAGSAKTIELGFDIIRRGGKCIFASHPAVHERISLDPFELICGKKIEGTWGGASMPDQDMKKFDAYFKQGLLPLEKLISKQYELKNINDAIIDLKNRKIARALIRCN